MNRDVVNFPGNLPHCGVFNLELNIRGRSAGDGVTGAGQVIYGVRPRWEADFEIVLKNRSSILTWRAFLSQMRGRVNVIKMEIKDPLRPTFSEMGLTDEDIGYAESGIPFEDGALFDDDVGFAIENQITFASDVSIGSSSLTVDAASINDALLPGHFFSINEWLYRVSGISGTMPARTYVFEPPLRAAVASGDLLKVDAEILMVFESDLVAMPEMKMRDFSRQEFRLIEHVNR